MFCVVHTIPQEDEIPRNTQCENKTKQTDKPDQWEQKKDKSLWLAI